jgi:hypothetical protein
VTEQLDWVPGQVDMDKPSAARMYDYLLGGAHNLQADRVLVDSLLQARPNARATAVANRDFLRRSVSFLLDHGVRQFLDLGSGIPTVGNVHEITQRVAPESRVVYVDHDAAAVAHGRLILEHNERAAILQADLSQPDDVLRAPETRSLLDFQRPIGVLMLALPHFVGAELDAIGTIARYRDALPSGSWLALTHIDRGRMPADEDAVVEVMKSGASPTFPPSRAEIVEMFDGFDLVEPGLVPAPLWRPDSPVDHSSINNIPLAAGVGRKP